MTTRYYHSQEAGAPQLSQTPGHIIPILKACLVNGFGSRTPAGWSVAFEDQANKKIAFQQGGAGGNFLRVDHSEDYRYCRVNGFATMSDIDTGTEGLYSADAEGCGFWPAGYTTPSTMRWYVIASERFVYLMIVYVNPGIKNHYGWAGFAGDIEPADASQQYLFAMSAFTLSSWAYSPSSAQGTQSLQYNEAASMRIQREVSGLPGVSGMRYLNPSFMSLNGLVTNFGSRNDLTYPDPLKGGLLCRKAQVVQSQNRCSIGALPALMEPLNYYFNFSTQNIAYSGFDASVISDAGKTWVLIPVIDFSSSLMWEVDSTNG